MTIAPTRCAGRTRERERPGAAGVHHGLWLLPTSWTVGAIFDEAGYARWHPTGRATRTPSKRPTLQPETVAGTRSARSPTRPGGVDTLDRKPVVIGHCLVGCWRRSRRPAACRPPQSLSTRPGPGRAAAAVSALRAAVAGAGNPANRHRAVPLTFEQFRL